MRTVDRILTASDLHGQSSRFLRLLQKTEYDPSVDLLVICGDLIDRGEENLECLAACQKLQAAGATVLKGNHEQFLEACLIEMLDGSWPSRPSAALTHWITYNGGETMFAEIKDLSRDRLTELLRFIQKLPLYLAAGPFIFTHAGANVKKPIEENTEDELVWMDKAFPYFPAYPDKVMVFGHVPTWQLYNDQQINRKKARIWYDTGNRDKIGLDCGAVFGGRLALLELPTYREFYE